MFDHAQLQFLRTECAHNNIDMSRASIRPSSGGGYVVTLSTPLVDIHDMVDDVPHVVERRSAAQAEGEMLSWLLKIQRAERNRVRLGRVVGWDTSKINRTPLSDAELRDYRAEVDHRRAVEKLRNELQEALAAKEERRKQNAAAAELSQRYGLKPPRTAAGAQAPRQRRSGAAQVQAEE